jgi:hypothetical protein
MALVLITDCPYCVAENTTFLLYAFTLPAMVAQRKRIDPVPFKEPKC